VIGLTDAKFQLDNDVSVCCKIKCGTGSGMCGAFGEHLYGTSFLSDDSSFSRHLLRPTA